MQTQWQRLYANFAGKNKPWRPLFLGFLGDYRRIFTRFFRGLRRTLFESLDVRSKSNIPNAP